MNVIKVSNRDFSVKAKKLRRTGFVPGSVCGGGLPRSISLQLKDEAARELIRHKREGSKITLALDGQLIPAQLKEKTVSSLTGDILHLVFQALKDDQKVNSLVHLVLTNTDKVTATLENMLFQIPYAALPADMIDTIAIDVDGMAVGTVLTVGDIPQLNSDRIDLKISKEEIVLRITDRHGIRPQTAES